MVDFTMTYYDNVCTTVCVAENKPNTYRMQGNTDMVFGLVIMLILLIITTVIILAMTITSTSKTAISTSTSSWEIHIRTSSLPFYMIIIFINQVLVTVRPVALETSRCWSHQVPHRDSKRLKSNNWIFVGGCCLGAPPSGGHRSWFQQNVVDSVQLMFFRDFRCKRLSTHNA